MKRRGFFALCAGTLAALTAKVRHPQFLGRFYRLEPPVISKSVKLAFFPTRIGVTIANVEAVKRIKFL